MACFHPLKAFYTLGSDNKKQITFYNPAKNLRPYEFYPDDIKIDIPCGQCLGCRLEYSRQWATRCVLEATQYNHNYFVTLTYNPEHLPIQDNPIIDKETGELKEIFESSPLVPEHLTKFMKDLRRYFEYHHNHTGIRFFACGEYGDKFMRPHFHLILFNCPIPDLILLKTSFNGDVYWRSPILESIWSVRDEVTGKKEPRGFVCVGSCTFDTCAYVARYMMKKQKGKNSNYYASLGLTPPFTRCSRDPGIARSFYDDERDRIYEYDSLVITGKDGVAKKVKPPKYYDRLYDIQCPDDLRRIKSAREESAKNGIARKLEHTDLDYDTYLSVCESNFESKMNKLLRPLE